MEERVVKIDQEPRSSLTIFEERLFERESHEHQCRHPPGAGSPPLDPGTGWMF